MRRIYSFGFERPPVLQQKGIKSIILNRDTIAQAQSATGKTANFTIGLLQNIDTSLPQCQALILVATRELAQQISLVGNQIRDYMKVCSNSCIGGKEDIRILE